MIRIPREYRVGLFFFLLGCCAYAAIHLHHFRSHTEQRIEVASFGLIGFGTGQLCFGWAVRRKQRQKHSAEAAVAAESSVQAFIAAINRHSLPELAALMSSDHTFIDSQGHAQSGRDAMLEAWRSYFAMFPDYQIRADRLVVDGDFVGIFGEASGTFSGKRGLVPENRIAMPAAWKSNVQEGRIALWQVYADWTEGMKVIARESKNG